MYIQIGLIPNKKYLFFLIIFALLTLFTVLFFSSKAYAQPIDYTCLESVRYRYNFNTMSWDLHVAAGIPANPGEWNPPVAHPPPAHCSMGWTLEQAIGEGESRICAFQRCKKVSGDYICEGDFTLDELMNDAVAFDSSKWLVWPTADSSGCVDVSSADSCRNTGGFPAGANCYQFEQPIDYSIDNGSDCIAAEGMWYSAPLNFCVVPQHTKLTIDPWDSDVNCGAGGEEACVVVWWLRRPIHLIAPVSPGRVAMSAMHIFNAPEKPSIFSTSISACIKENYVPVLGWNYDHLGGFQQNAYQLRIATNNTFDIDLATGDPNFADPSVEFSFGGGPCDNCMNANAGPSSTTINNSFTPPNSGDFGAWLSGKWGGIGTIYWTVRVRDSVNNYWSHWSDVQSFRLPLHPYPYVDFDWEPFGVPPASKPSVPLGTEIQFDATTSEFFGMPGTETVVWDFGGDADEDLTDIYRPVVVYRNPNPTGYTARLTITDPAVDLNQADPNISVSPNTSGDGGVMRCHLNRNPIKVIWQIPRYREVAPR